MASGEIEKGAKRFEELWVWQQARELVKEVYEDVRSGLGSIDQGCMNSMRPLFDPRPLGPFDSCTLGPCNSMTLRPLYSATLSLLLKKKGEDYACEIMTLGLFDSSPLRPLYSATL